MVELTKEKNLGQGISNSLEKANNFSKGILFSYSFRFEVRDLLPILTHPSDKHTIRIYMHITPHLEVNSTLLCLYYRISSE